MKKTLLASVITLASATILSAQVTITYANHGINVGDAFTYYPADTVGVQAGPSGSNQTWNFSNLNIGTTSGLTNYVAPASTPYGSSFSTSNLATSDASGNYGYYNSTSSALNLTGVANASTTVPYSNPELTMSYPFAYSNTMTDNFYSTYTSNSVNAIRSGTITLTADGSGTLILPSGSYTVLRVKGVQDFSDSLIGFYSVQYHFVSYWWYAANQKFPLMTFSQLSTTIMSNTSYSESVIINSQVVGISESPSLITSVNLFPNPANENAHLNFTVAENQNVNILVTDLEGRVIENINRGQLAAGEYTETLDLATLPKGIYMVKVQGEKSFACQKLIVE